MRGGEVGEVMKNRGRGSSYSGKRLLEGRLKKSIEGNEGRGTRGNEEN